MIEFKFITLNEENIVELEKLRYDAYGIIDNNINYSKTFFANELKNKKYVVCCAYLDSNLIAACYISNSFNSLYVEQLFVKKRFQRKNLNIGKQLLNYVLNNKINIENYFNQVFNYSLLSTRNKDLDKYYEEFGYKKVNDIYMKKAI